MAKQPKSNTSCVFNTNNTSARSYVCPIWLCCLPSGPRLFQQYFNKTDMSYAESTEEYEQEYFQP